MRTVLSTRRRCVLGRPGFCALFSVLCTLLTAPARAESCASGVSLAPCFDANSLWLPAGPAAFMTLPDTRVSAPRKMNFGIATELLRAPVVAHVASPDSSGRDVQIVDYAFDASLFAAVGVLDNLQLSLTLPTRLYQRGAGAGGVTSQSAPPVEQTALRDPRLGAAYSLDDALARTGIGLRLALDVSLPLGNEAAFSGERSVVVQPSATTGWQSPRFALRASVGARLRSATDFGDVRLGNEGFLALGAGVDVLDPGLLFLSLEGWALPPLGGSRAPTANAAVSGVSLLPAEWLFAVRSSFRPDSEWSLSAAFGTGLPVSSETRRSPAGESTSYFLGMTEPEWRTLLAVRFAPK